MLNFEQRCEIEIQAKRWKTSIHGRNISKSPFIYKSTHTHTEKLVYLIRILFRTMLKYVEQRVLVSNEY